MKKRSKKFGIKKIIISIILLILLFLLVGAGLNYKTIEKIYTGVTLFQPSKMNERFRNLDQKFSSRKVEPSETIFHLEKNLKDLPEDYMYLGEKHSVNDFIKRTNTTGLIVIQDDKITYEEYFNGYKETDRMITWSVSKSIISH